jgi:dTDP-4-amino-4,6-dideoxygalactose transaminase
MKNIELFQVTMSPEAINMLEPVLSSGYVAQGHRVELFEDALWRSLSTAKTKPVTVNSGTSAINLAIELCNVNPGDEIISTPMTCFATQIGAIHRGAKIRWADVNPLTGLIDPDSVEKLITKKTKAIIAVDWAGRLPDYKKLKSFGVPVIEDAAHCWDTFETKDVERGDYICYSFQAIKFLTTSDGGAIICPVETEREAKNLRWFGLDRTSNESFRYKQDIKRAGFKYHMNDVCATIGLANIEYANNAVKESRKNAKLFCDELSDLDHITVLPFDETCSYWIFPIILNDINREEFMKYLLDNRIVSSPTHHRNDQNTCTLEFKEGPLPGLDLFNENQLNIPVGWWLTDKEKMHIIDTIKNWK